jgi:hypothetical protein
MYRWFWRNRITGKSSSKFPTMFFIRFIPKSSVLNCTGYSRNKKCKLHCTIHVSYRQRIKLDCVTSHQILQRIVHDSIGLAVYGVLQWPLNLPVVWFQFSFENFVHTTTARKYICADKGPNFSTHIFRRMWSTAINTSHYFIWKLSSLLH